MNETDIQQQIRLALSESGCKIFRNNCGKLQDKHGRWVSFGVASPGGSDLIGWTPTTVTADMVGSKIAIFTAIEVKTTTGRISPQQLNFIDRVRLDGGIAGVARTVSEAIKITNQPHE